MLPLAAQSGTAQPWVVYFLGVMIVVVVMMTLSFILGQRHFEKTTGLPYESGVISFETARLRLSAKFYQVALFFVIFDLEAVFIFAWAVSFRAVGWSGYMELLTFVGVLGVALIYLWRLGALNWGERKK